MRRQLQVVALGSGDYIFESFFQEMQAKYPGKMAVKIGFIPDLARKIYAGSDVFLMPSKSEPCGLAQMVSLRYGTLPIVRETNGFTFKTYNAHDMLGAIDRAGGLYYNRDEWKKAVHQAMQSDFTWGRSAVEYINMYKKVLGQ